MRKRGRPVLFKEEVADPGKRITGGQAGEQPPEIQRRERMQHSQQTQRGADEVQTAAGPVRMLRKVERIEVRETAEGMLSHAPIVAMSRNPLQMQNFNAPSMQPGWAPKRALA